MAAKKWGLDKVNGFSFENTDDLVTKVLLLLNTENRTGGNSDKSHMIPSSNSRKRITKIKN